jgi:hypothetical protein
MGLQIRASGWQWRSALAAAALGGCVIGAIAGAIPFTWRSSVTVQFSNYLLTPHDCDRTVQIGIGGTGFFSFTLPPAAGFREGCKITIRNGDDWPGGGKALLGAFPPDFTNGKGILWPLQPGAVQVIGGKWATVMRPGRPKLPDKDTFIYTDYSVVGGDAGHDCLAPGPERACQTAAHALTLACNEFEFSGTDLLQSRAHVMMAKGVTDRAWIHYACPGAAPGANGGAHLILDGQGSAKLEAIGLDAIGVFVGATLEVQNLTIATDTGDCLRADYGGRLFAGIGLTFLNCASGAMEARNNGQIYLQSDYRVAGNSAFHMKATHNGIISKEPSGATITATIAAGVRIGDWMVKDTGGVIDPPTLIQHRDLVSEAHQQAQ